MAGLPHCIMVAGKAGITGQRGICLASRTCSGNSSMAVCCMVVGRDHSRELDQRQRVEAGE